MKDNKRQRTGKQNKSRPYYQKTTKKRRARRAQNGPIPKSGRQVPKEVFVKARQIADRSGINMVLAVEVAKGNMTTAQAVERMLLLEKIKKARSQQVLSKYMAERVLKGEIDLDAAIAITQLSAYKKKPEFAKCRLEEFAKNNEAVGLAVVGRKILYGVIAQESKWEILLKQQNENELQRIKKHDIKFYFKLSERKKVLRAISKLDGYPTLKPDYLRTLKHRKSMTHINVYTLYKQGKSVTSISLEGEKIRGRITWFGKYEIVLHLPKGADVILMRHALESLS